MNTSVVYEKFEPRRGVTPVIKTLAHFLALTFVLSWGAIALLILFPAQMTALFGEMNAANPLFILAVYSPGIAGVFIVWRQYGIKGLGSFFQRLTLWRAPMLWWLYLLVGIPVIVYAAAALKGTLRDPFPFSPWYLVLPALAQSLFLGPIEEFGWRGLALPLLQRRFAPIWAGLFLGVTWATWHLSAFMLSGTPQSAWSFGPFFVGVIAIAVIQVPLFNASKGSLLIAALYHLQMMNPVFPDAQPWDSLLFTAAAVVIVWLNRRTMFRRGNGITKVLMPEDR
jgi:membrane protease YdiL (CAAX protease family)